jgi:hypothetical protein
MSYERYKFSFERCTCPNGYGCSCRKDGGFTFMNQNYSNTSESTTCDDLTSVAQLPLASASGNSGIIERYFHSPRRHLSPSSFETNKKWPEIEDAMSTYLREKSIAFDLPETEAVFYVKGVPDDLNLNFNIFCCPTEHETFIVEFRRVKGEIHALSNIYLGIMSLLVESTEELDN